MSRRRREHDDAATAIPLVDLFAGPGGLGEGFTALRQAGRRVFASVLSIEKEASAHQTLRLRAFFRQFPEGQVPDGYYRLFRDRLTLEELYHAHPDQAVTADMEAWRAELGASAVDDVRRRIAVALDGADPWVLLGGPPCQPFSLAGRSRNRAGTRYSDGRDTRHELYVEYLQIIADFWPAVFVMENVRGLLSAKYNGQGMFQRIHEDLRNPAAALRRAGRTPRSQRSRFRYHLFPVAMPADGAAPSMFEASAALPDFLVRCERHGIPQARHRLIFLGVRDDLAATPRPIRAQEPVPAGRVLAGLPKLRSGLSRDDCPKAWRSYLVGARTAGWLRELHEKDRPTADAVRRQLDMIKAPRGGRGSAWHPNSCPCGYHPAAFPDWYHDERLDGVANHESRGHMPEDLHRYLFAACFAEVHNRSPSLVDFPQALLPAHRSVADALAGGHFADRFRVQLAGRPATTVVSHIAKDGHYYIHPDPGQCRSLTVREAARLQTFPDNYFFVGNRTEQYVQVGNAVPPLLAAQIADVVHDLLSKNGLV